MPQMIPMQATVAFDHKGKRVQEGEPIEVTPLEAAALRFNRKARFLKASELPAARERLLERRDLEAAERSSPAEPDSPRRGRRRYHRTDLDADK